MRRRLITAGATFIVVYLLNFIIPRLEPGNFIASLSDQTDLLPEQRLKIIQMFGLDQPISVQFVNYLRQTLLTFPPNFGFSFSDYPMTVLQLISIYLPWTLLLIMVSQAIAWPLGIVIGTMVAWRQGSFVDSTILAISSFMWGVPSYWLANIFIFVFSINLHLLPPSLLGTGFSSFNLLSRVSEILTHSALPILTLVALNLPGYAVVMRNTMIRVKQEDFMLAAEARGLSSRTLMFAHGARNALLPSVTNIAHAFGNVLSGAYLIEITYSYPGMGYLISQAAFSRDLPVLQGVFFFSALLVIMSNVLADVAYVILDPRIEYRS
jgi:peptide/nickel transport system permease protein